ncbi:MAG: aconitate hydratase [Chloroflexi bacterium]|nr:aconitate hydratase [Chloroflexota bacterium]MCI0785125.1 aconitate hydratase [Chloroflexota bacterium]MCI0799369.1 aconitate hydratase [Chloroflexota bacterium]MCI0823457.1 aconitate hydratase [Chloroflexota bacterium]MCI0865075.1 aconitate hydratase [Chloroflexota bacterium]
MVATESTPEFVSGVYATMKRNLEVVRRRVDGPIGLGDKLLLSHLDDPSGQELIPGSSYLLARPDRVILQDVLGQTAMLQFMQTRMATTAVPTTVHCDHLIQARVEGVADLRESLSENNEVYDFLRSASAKYGVGFWGPGAGIIHQVCLEEYAFPGALIIGTDSHTPNAGGLGACAVGVGGADAVEVMAGLPWEVLYPNRIGVLLTGELSGWTAPKDIILYLAGELTVSGGTNTIIEYFGPGTQSISCTGKATITNMGAELGATTSVFPYDERMARYLRATRRGELAVLADQNRELLTADQGVVDHPERYFDRVVEIDLSKLEPYVVGPHSPDRARPISAMAQEIRDQANGFVDQISTALIGSCTNSSYEDMSRSADVAEQASALGIKAAVPLMVTPGSEQVRATIERDGQLESLRAIGGTVLANACGPCIGQWRRSREASEAPNTIVTSYNRNFPRRNDGQPQTMNFITSPEITVALALAGRLSFNPLTDTVTDSQGNEVKLQPPKPAPDVPERGFDPGDSNFIAPPEDGSNIEVVVDPNSQRIEIMEPWDPWDGNDVLEAPVAMKVQGKCTTDHISPAGPWLSLRGHLSKFSENFLMGATNAYTGEAGKGLDVLSGETDQAVSKIARHYQAEGLKWVVIGDHNYGEGSSREHAALSPRLLGGAAVIARSFARIHETNLKKQGLLALTFSSPDDYDRVREDDRVSLTGLKDLAPGKPVDCTLHHSDGTTESLKLNHTFGESQIEWFRVGSALNLFHT